MRSLSLVLLVVTLTACSGPRAVTKPDFSGVRIGAPFATTPVLQSPSRISPISKGKHKGALLYSYEWDLPGDQILNRMFSYAVVRKGQIEAFYEDPPDKYLRDPRAARLAIQDSQAERAYARNWRLRALHRQGPTAPRQMDAGSADYYMQMYNQLGPREYARRFGPRIAELQARLASSGARTRPNAGGIFGRFNPDNPFSEYSKPTGRYNPDNPFSEYASPTGRLNPDNPFSEVSSPTGRLNPDNPFSEVSSPTGRLNPDNPFSEVSSPFGRFNPDNPFGEGVHPYYYQNP